ncbi:MAG TPA: hypothetical protein VMN36_17310 [Verrucomicrobiales bacterium]|nr:hypothetical protein [Verrucomicrobiales bacterium]
MWTRSAIAVVLTALAGLPARAADTSSRVAAIEALGGKVFYRPGTGIPVEVQLHGLRQVDPGGLRHLGDFKFLTGLSLEQCALTDEHTDFLIHLRRLKWLNFYQTGIGDATLARIAGLTPLEGIALGETQVTDRGLLHLAGLPRLRYLGLRATGVTVQAAKTVSKWKTLTGLHFGETGADDDWVTEIAALPRLEKLWLHDSAVTDGSVPRLARMRNLRLLDLRRSACAIDGIRRLREALPECRILYEKDP